MKYRSGHSSPTVLFGPREAILKTDEGRRVVLGPCEVLANRKYELAVEVQDGVLTAYVDGRTIGRMSWDWAARPGRVGLAATHDEVYWDDFAMEGEFASTYAPAVTGRMLKNTWDETGRINAEMHSVNPLIALSDISHYAKVTHAVPAQKVTPYVPGAYAEAAALLAGLDSIVLVVVNHALEPFVSKYESGPLGAPRPPKYPAVDCTVSLRLPKWLKPRHIFRVSSAGITDLKPKRSRQGLKFHLPQLVVSDLIVLTQDDAVAERIIKQNAEWMAHLDSGNIDLEPVKEDPLLVISGKSARSQSQ